MRSWSLLIPLLYATAAVCSFITIPILIYILPQRQSEIIWEYNLVIHVSFLKESPKIMKTMIIFLNFGLWQSMFGDKLQNVVVVSSRTGKMSLMNASQDFLRTRDSGCSSGRRRERIPGLSPNSGFGMFLRTTSLKTRLWVESYKTRWVESYWLLVGVKKCTNIIVSCYRPNTSFHREV
jgi:hypothetical protein